MELKDLIITPVYLLIFYLILFLIRKKECKTQPEIKKFFMPAITLKFAGAIFLGLIYQFYYNGGDTFNYFNYGSAYIMEALVNEPLAGLQLIFRDCSNPISGDATKYASNILFKNDPASYFIIRLSALFGIFCFHTYTVIALFFALVSFSGSWALYKTVLKVYPNLYQSFAIAIFFVPSIFFWGSGLLKDSLTFGAAGWLIYAFYNVFFEKKKIFLSALILLISIWVINTVKVYIILCLIPALIVWLILHFNYKIKSKATRIMLFPLISIFAISMGLFASQKLAAGNKRYAFSKILHTAEETSEWLQYVSKTEDGSVYYLGDIDFNNPFSIIKFFPAGVNVTFFRPYLWEANNIVMLFSAIESLIFLFLSVRVLFKTGLLKTFAIIRNHPFIIFCLLFSLVFGFAVGTATSNFGSLVRYKIPALPFYLFALFAIRHEHLKEKFYKKNKQFTKLNT